jgi:hypothetical protein
MKKIILGIGLALLAAFVSSAVMGQDLSDKRAAEPGATLDATVEQAHVAIKAAASCSTGAATLGVPINGALTLSDCSSSTSSGTFYADFYAFTATAAHTLTVTSHSTLSYLATIQDYSSGAVLASSDSCGFMHDSCTFTYAVLTSGNYLLGFGAYGLGGYTVTVSDSTAAPPCGDAWTLCLNSSRFKVEVAYYDAGGQNHCGPDPNASPPNCWYSGVATRLSADTGYFWFFNSANVELVVKVLDGTAINGHYWVFYGALSNVNYSIRVTDTQTGARKVYDNPQGLMASVGDTEAF